MPLYDYVCKECGQHFDTVLPLSDCDLEQLCPVCAGPSKKIVVLGHGGIHRKDSEWVRTVAAGFNRDEITGPIQTVEDLRRFYADNPHIRPKESHPALPSSLDPGSPPNPDVAETQMKRAGIEKLTDMRRVSISTR